jgi:hypothetical protein
VVRSASVSAATNASIFACASAVDFSVRRT